jgi:hypothetical protein
MVFVERVRAYKLMAKYVKNVGAKVHSTRYPASDAGKGNLDGPLYLLKE